MNKKTEDRIALAVGCILLFLVACAICYAAGYKAAKAAEIKTKPVVSLSSLTRPIPQDWSEMQLAIQERDGRLAREAEEAEQKRIRELPERTQANDSAAGGDYRAIPATIEHTSGVEQWRSLVAEIWGVVPTDHIVDEVLSVMEGESHGDQCAYNPGGPYVGLMQMSACDFWTVERLMNPAENLLCCKIQWDASRWQPWECKPYCGGCF